MHHVFIMRTIKPHVYSGEPRAVGDNYEAASERDARVMTMMGNAVEAAPESYRPPQANVEAPKKPARPTPTPKDRAGRYTKKDEKAAPDGRYLRRDQRAEH